MRQARQRITGKAAMTPLWVISLFVSLTEVITGIAVTQATGSVQIALTAFVIAFPILVASAFFIILWSRPFVFYPPADFTGGVNVNDYVKAMSRRVEVVRADLQAETGNIRASLGLEVEVFQNRLNSLEAMIADLSNQTQDAKRIFEEHRGYLQQRMDLDKLVRSTFEKNSSYRIEVVTATRHPASKYQEELVRPIAERLTNLGYRTSCVGWGSSFFFPEWDEGNEGNLVKLAYKTRRKGLAESVSKTLNDLTLSVPISLVPLKQIAPKDGDMSDLLDADIDLVVAYCIR